MQRKRTTLLAATALALAGLGLPTGNALAAPIVEDFESYSVGTVLDGVGGWNTDAPSASDGVVTDDPVTSGNQVGFFQRTGGLATGGRYLDLGGNNISDGSTGEFSLRFLFDGLPNSVFGLSTLSSPDVSANGGAGTQLSVLFRLNRGDLQYMVDQSHSIFVPVATDLNTNTWYTVSADINNATDTVSNIRFEGSLAVAGPLTFNLGATAAPTHGDLVSFAVYEQGFTQGIYLDDIRVGETAVSAVPAPASVLLLTMGLGLMLLMHSRRRAEGGLLRIRRQRI